MDKLGQAFLELTSAPPGVGKTVPSTSPDLLMPDSPNTTQSGVEIENNEVSIAIEPVVAEDIDNPAHHISMSPLEPIAVEDVDNPTSMSTLESDVPCVAPKTPGLTSSSPELSIVTGDDQEAVLCPICQKNGLRGGMHCSSCQVKTCNVCTAPYQADAGDGRGVRLQLLCTPCLDKRGKKDVKALPFMRKSSAKSEAMKLKRRRRWSMPASAFPGLQVREVKECPNCQNKSSDFFRCEACKRDTCFKCTEEHKLKKLSKKMLCSSCASIIRDKKDAPKRRARRKPKAGFDLFSASIQECVEMQRSSGFTGPTHPVFIEYLIEKSVQLGALSAEGIFRLAVKGPEVLAAQQMLTHVVPLP